MATKSKNSAPVVEQPIEEQLNPAPVVEQISECQNIDISSEKATNMSISQVLREKRKQDSVVRLQNKVKKLKHKLYNG